MLVSTSTYNCGMSSLLFYCLISAVLFTFLQKTAAQALMKRTEKTPTMKERMEERRKHHHFLSARQALSSAELSVITVLTIIVKLYIWNNEILKMTETKNKYLTLENKTLLILFKVWRTAFGILITTTFWNDFWNLSLIFVNVISQNWRLYRAKVLVELRDFLF